VLGLQCVPPCLAAYYIFRYCHYDDNSDGAGFSALTAYNNYKGDLKTSKNGPRAYPRATELKIPAWPWWLLGRLRSGGSRFHASPGKSSRDSISKITRANWIGGMVQEVESLLCKYEALSSNPRPTEKQKQNKTIREQDPGF
jgi:hypothetical protein